jgi:hypothetical protein
MKDQVTKSGLLPVTIQAGRIVDVHPDRMTCDVQVELGQRNLYRDCLLLAGYFNFSLGSGILGMPEAGALVWVARASEGSDRLFVVGYRGPANQAGSFAGKLRPMAQGDLMMVSKNNNGVRVYREGSVEIRGVSPLLFVSLEAHQQTFRTHANNYYFQSPGAEIAITTQMPEEDLDYVESCRIRTKVRAFADEKYAAVETHIGGALEDLFEEGNEPTTVTTPVLRTFVREDSDTSTMAVQVLADREGRAGLEVKDARVLLRDNGDVVIYQDDETAAEPFILGITFLTDLQSSLTEISTALTAIGVPVTVTAQFLTDIGTSLSTNSPYLTPKLKVE